MTLAFAQSPSIKHGLSRSSRLMPMSRHIRENVGQRAGTDGAVIGNGDVMLSTLLRGQTDVGAFLTCCGVSDARESFDKVAARQITRQLHTAITSSRTK